MGSSEEIVDFGTHPIIYADEMTEAAVIGANVRIKLADWRLIEGKRCRVIVAELIRPLASIRNPIEVMQMAAVHMTAAIARLN